MSDTTFHEIEFLSPEGPLIKERSVQMWRVISNPAQARAIAEIIDHIGFEVQAIRRADCMSIEDACKKFKGLELVAQINAPSPFNEDGSLTEAAIQGIRDGAHRVYKDGKLVVPEGKS